MGQKWEVVPGYYPGFLAINGTPFKSVSFVTKSTGLTLQEEIDRELAVHLMAAAPELLDVLIELTDLEGPLPGNREWHAKALSAIAKATGAQS